MPSSVQMIMDIFKCYLYANVIKIQGRTHLMEFTKCQQKGIEMLNSVTDDDAGCNSRYIGETTRRLTAGMKEPTQTDKNVHMFKHLEHSSSSKKSV